MANKHRYHPILRSVLMAGALGSAITASCPAIAQNGNEKVGMSQLFGFSEEDYANITVSNQELQSLGCLVASAGIGVAAVLFGGAAIIVTRGQGAAAATTVAVPVLATAMFAGCSLGAQAAPGIAWLQRNSEALFGKVVNAIPASPLVKTLPEKQE